ncbi:unnamed protein product [Rhizophagus irregularis]|nr:unnamed protein product [Rhizophagus irregularis]
MRELVWKLEIDFLGGSLGLLKYEFGGSLSDFADSYLSFLGFDISFFIFQCLFCGNKDLSSSLKSIKLVNSFHPSNAWDFEDQVFGSVKTW